LTTGGRRGPIVVFASIYIISVFRVNSSINLNSTTFSTSIINSISTIFPPSSMKVFNCNKIYPVPLLSYSIFLMANSELQVKWTRPEFSLPRLESVNEPRLSSCWGVCSTLEHQAWVQLSGQLQRRQLMYMHSSLVVAHLDPIRVDT
jgi:hypothetical protein